MVLMTFWKSKKEQTANFEQVFNYDNKSFAHFGYFSVDKKCYNIWNVKKMFLLYHHGFPTGDKNK